MIVVKLTVLAFLFLFILVCLPAAVEENCQEFLADEADSKLVCWAGETGR
jgi:hypothetical protein